MAFDSIFTSQIPNAYADDSTYTLGTVFKSDVDGSIYGIRMYVGNVPTSAPDGALYTVDGEFVGTLLWHTPFGVLTPNAWNEVLFGTPVSITAETLYVAAAGPLDKYVATTGFFDFDPVINGHLMAPHISVWGNGRFNFGGGLAYPANSYRSSCYFIDVLFSPNNSEAAYTNTRFFLAL